MSPERLLALIVGILLGLVAAALFSLPLSLLPSPFREILPLIAAIGLVYVSVALLMMRTKIYKELSAIYAPMANENLLTKHKKMSSSWIQA